MASLGPECSPFDPILCNTAPRCNELSGPLSPPLMMMLPHILNWTGCWNWLECFSLFANWEVAEWVTYTRRETQESRGLMLFEIWLYYPQWRLKWWTKSEYVIQKHYKWWHTTKAIVYNMSYKSNKYTVTDRQECCYQQSNHNTYATLQSS